MSRAGPPCVEAWPRPWIIPGAAAAAAPRRRPARTAPAEEHTREKDAMTEKYSAEFAKLTKMIVEHKAQYDRDQAKAAQEKTEVAKEYARYKENAAQEKVEVTREYAKYKETTTSEKLATAEKYARDMAAIEDARLREEKRHEAEFSFLTKEMDTMKSRVCSLVILSSFPCSDHEPIAQRYNL